MPNFNRRSILHMMGAASLAPAMPALSTRAAATGGATHAQLLWASLYKNAGSAANFTRITSGLGMSAATAQRMHAKLAGSRLLLANGAVRVQSAPPPAPRAVKAPSAAKPNPKRALSDIRRRFVEGDEDLAPISSQAPGDQPPNGPDDTASPSE